MDVGVRGTLDVSVGLRDERIASEQVVNGLKDCDRGQQDTEVNLHLRANARRYARGPNPTVEVVKERRDECDHHHGHQGPRHHEVQKTQSENVEANVLMKDRVDAGEALGMSKEDVVLPLRNGAQTGNEPNDQCHERVETAGEGTNERLKPTNEFVLGLKGQIAGGKPRGEQQVAPEHHEERRPKHNGEPHFDRKETSKDGALAD